MPMSTTRTTLASSRTCLVLVTWIAACAASAAEVGYPPALPAGAPVVTDRTEEFLQRPESLPADVAVAKTPPTIDFLYYPEQTYAGHPWSVWGDGSVTGDKYFSAIGDHLAPAGNAFV